MNEMYEIYEKCGISRKIYEFGEKVLGDLAGRFAVFDSICEHNQLKVINAMQSAKVSEACFMPSSGYGYNDLGRDTLEKVYAKVFGTEDALVRPQITCGTHALNIALSANLRPGDELLSVSGKPLLHTLFTRFQDPGGSYPGNCSAGLRPAALLP